MCLGVVGGRFGVVVCVCERAGNLGRGEGEAMMQEVCAPEESNFLRFEAEEVCVDVRPRRGVRWAVYGRRCVRAVDRSARSARH